jgi:hypothetical protein
MRGPDGFEAAVKTTRATLEESGRPRPTQLPVIGGSGYALAPGSTDTHIGGPGIAGSG